MTGLGNRWAEGKMWMCKGKKGQGGTHLFIRHYVVFNINYSETN